MQIDFTNVPKHYASRTHEKMTEVLMDPNGVGPAIHYYMIRGGVDQKNTTVWEPGTISGEYIKTYGHYHVGDLSETYFIAYGQGVALLQKLAEDENGEMIPDVVAEFKAIPVKTGDELFMPAKFGHLVANTGSTYFVTIDDSPVDFEDRDPSSFPGHADYSLVKQMHGFAYYVVEHNGAPALKRNPLYKTIEKEELNGLPVIN
ncbi:MAG: glucose-6-phosphate isomerase family protein [Candidatus Moranbacteria bacterium]|nr:glucose-6-phosphate isomerase family protein [Candidatus Moranbacteria bacterium]